MQGDICDAIVDNHTMKYVPSADYYHFEYLSNFNFKEYTAREGCGGAGRWKVATIKVLPKLGRPQTRLAQLC